MEQLLRVYFEPWEIGPDGYPYLWHGHIVSRGEERPDELAAVERQIPDTTLSTPSIKDYVREQAGHRCQRCHHPYIRGMGEWSPCDEWCRHGGPIRRENFESGFGPPEAQWRILTVHHLNGVKFDCRWWNLVALCQRCHLTIQGKVVLERPWAKPHSEWFKPYAAGYYACAILGEELTRAEVMARLDELLDLQLRQNALW